MGEGAAAARGGRRAGDRVKLLAVAVAGRGLVDPGRAGVRRRRRGAPARARGVRDDARLRRRGRSGSPSTSRGSARRRRASRLPPPDPDECLRLAALAVDGGRDAARRRRCGSTGPGRRSSRRVAAIPAELEERRAARDPARLARARRRRLAARLAASRREVDELRGEHGGRGRGAAARRRRRALPRRRRDRARGADLEHLVASRRHALHAGGRGRRARRRHARDDARARARRPATRVEEGAFAIDDLRAADEAFTSSSIREIVPAVELDGARSATARRARRPRCSSAGCASSLARSRVHARGRGTLRPWRRRSGSAGWRSRTACSSTARPRGRARSAPRRRAEGGRRAEAADRLERHAARCSAARRGSPRRSRSCRG